MGKRYVDSGIACPYYCSEDPNKVYCLGIEEENWIHMTWGDGKKKKKYKYIHCRRDWRSCPIAKVKMELDNASGG